MKRPYLVFLIVALVAIFVGPMIANRARQGVKPMDGQPGVYESNRDPEIAAAVMRAKKELPKFILALKEHPDAEFAINAKFLTPQGPEQLWVRVDTYEKGVFRGELASEPVGLKEKKKGDPVEVVESNVSDWTYKLDGKTEGGFTTSVLRNR